MYIEAYIPVHSRAVLSPFLMFEAYLIDILAWKAISTVHLYNLAFYLGCSK
jgi:hypothetical protein